MKRTPELRDFSDDHHRALVLAKRARETAANAEPDAVATVWRIIRRAYESELAPHFAVEESHLVPPIRRAAGEELARRLEADHAAVRAGILDGPHDAPALAALAERLDAHVRFEERELFPFAERHLSKRELREAARAHEAASQRRHGEPS